MSGMQTARRQELQQTEDKAYQEQLVSDDTARRKRLVILTREFIENLVAGLNERSALRPMEPKKVHKK